MRLFIYIVVGMALIMVSVSLINKQVIAELKNLIKDWDMIEREPCDMKVHEYKDFETIRERIKELEGKE